MQSDNQLEHYRQAIIEATREDESQSLSRLIAAAELPENQLQHIQQQASNIITTIRSQKQKLFGLDSFLNEYELTSEEGIALMCLAESMLRIPDKQTIDKLITDKLGKLNWQAQRGQSDSVFINAATWALMLTGKVLQPGQEKKLFTTLKQFIKRSSQGAIRAVMAQAMKILGRQFVMGETIEQALKRAQGYEQQGYRFSYDMLGEAAMTDADAERYFQSYRMAIDKIGQHAQSMTRIDRPGISVKLSALHPRYEFAHRQLVVPVLLPKLLELCQAAAQFDIDFTIDAEEADVLELSLDLIEQLLPKLPGNWHGFGLAVQSYQKRAWFLLDWLAELAKQHQQRIKVRLIKGAYWDSEIKHSQQMGLKDFPVFTRKASTDVSFQACAKKLLSHYQYLDPQFATHNAFSVAMILQLAKDYQFEFQRLHGMGDILYQQIVPKDKLNIPCRVYAPVGSHEDLLPYLVRRLLENGANTSFVNRLIDHDAPIGDLIADPVAKIKKLSDKTHPKIAKPDSIFPERQNAPGLDLADPRELTRLEAQLIHCQSKPLQAMPIVNGIEYSNNRVATYSPINQKRVIGYLQTANETLVAQAIESAHSAYPAWSATPIADRAACLHRIADLYQQHYEQFIYLLIQEAGKTIPDAIAEIREAIDFCRYYAVQALDHLSTQTLAGYTGEHNQLSMHGRGVFACISPWNFPLAIFTGQVVACLVTGNAVIAKPAEQTPLIATMATQLMHQAGVVKQVLQLLPGDGESVGQQIVQHPLIAGVLFTGSTDTARLINQTLAARPGPIVPLIAETGGQNAMIVDSSALLEQVVADVVSSAFGSAGQRCSALRVLFIPQSIEQRFLTLLKGAIATLRCDDPMSISTDIGPVIDQDALNQLQQHALEMTKQDRLIATVETIPEQGTFFAPHVFRLNHLSELSKEHFGPILHLITYRSQDLDDVIAQINNTGYGLTLGIHSRINDTVHYIEQRVNAGNCYVNRNMTGAVVGLQSFGGQGLSGTGPKAGGPHYLSRLCSEKTLTINTTAAGGNASLLSLMED